MKGTEGETENEVLCKGKNHSLWDGKDLLDNLVHGLPGEWTRGWIASRFLRGKMIIGSGITDGEGSGDVRGKSPGMMAACLSSALFSPFSSSQCHIRKPEVSGRDVLRQSTGQLLLMFVQLLCLFLLKVSQNNIPLTWDLEPRQNLFHLTFLWALDFGNYYFLETGCWKINYK